MKRNWRDRLRAEIDRQLAAGRSYREISMAGGLKPDWLNQTIRGDMDPSVTRFLMLCEGLGVSPVAILTGQPLDREFEQLLRFWAVASERERQLLRAAIEPK